VRHFFLAICFTLAVGLFHDASAQDVAGIEEGIKPYGSYHGGDIDSVSMSNLNPGIHIPLIAYPQRGGKLNVGFEMVFDNPSLIPHVLCYPYKPYTCYDVSYTWYNSYFGAGGTVVNGTHAYIVPTFTRGEGCFSYNQGSPVCPRAPYEAVEPDGGMHRLGQLASGNWISMDATGYLWNPSTTTLTDHQGTRYTIGTGGFSTLIEDTNGNQITSTSSGWTDTMGRSIPKTVTSTTDYSGCTGPLPITSASLWSLPGPSGGTSTYKICFASISSSTYFPPGCSGVCAGAPNPGGPDIQSIVLPNGTAWTFEYDQSSNGTGFLSKVIFPTGGSISYTWVASTFCGGAPAHFWYPYSLGVNSRTVDANDGKGPHTWNYNQGTHEFYTSFQTTVTSPLGDDAVHSFGALSVQNCPAYETQLDEYHGSHSTGTLLKTTITDYNATGDPYQTDGSGHAYAAINVVPTHITTKYFTGSNTQTKRTEKDYDPGIQLNTYYGVGPNALYGLVTAQREYDYGTTSWGPLLRQTKTTYMALGGPNSASYLSNNILGLAYTVQTLNGAGAQMANSQYGYDESSLGSSGVGSSEQHDTAPPAGTYRGNQTSILHWLNSGTMTCQNGHAGGTGSNVTSKLTYFDTGTLQTSADPCGNTITYAYSSTFWAAFPTTITNPLSQPTTNNYDFNIGHLVSTKDPNNLTTSYTYDSMWRLYTVTHPDGEVDTITHQESTYPFSSTLTKTMNATQSVVTKNVFDGLGRTTQTQLSDISQGDIYTDTTYDVLGRVSTISNPYRSGTDVTTSSGITTYGYDALSRKTSEAYADSSVLTTAYCGADTLVTDPTLRWRRSRVDGLTGLIC
jgi:YD repeat-containing protein